MSGSASCVDGVCACAVDAGSPSYYPSHFLKTDSECDTPSELHLPKGVALYKKIYTPGSSPCALGVEAKYAGSGNLIRG